MRVGRKLAILWTALTLALACGGSNGGSNDVERSETTTPLATEGIQLISRESVSPGVFAHSYTASLRNGGGALDSATAFLVSAGPGALGVKQVLHYEAVAAGELAPSQDTITIHTSGEMPDPAAFEWLVLSYGPGTQVSRQRFDRTHVDFTYFVWLDHLGAEPMDIRATASSSDAALTVIDPVVEVSALPPGVRTRASDLFTIRQDRRFPFDPAALQWTLEANALVGLGDEGASPIAIEGLALVGESPDDTGFQTYKASLRNRGPPLSSATAFLIAAGPGAIVVEAILHFEAVPARGVTLSSDTFEIKNFGDALKAGDLEWLVLSYGADTQLSRERFDRTRVDFTYFTWLDNLTPRVLDLEATAKSHDMALTVLDPRVEAAALPPGLRTGSVDTFAFRHDRSSPFDPAKLEWALDPIQSSDQVAPAATITAPTQVAPQEVIRVSVRANDDVGVETVSFFVDELLVSEQTEPPFEITYNAPAQDGVSLEIRVVARDAAGNAGEARASVMVVALPDETPPVIDALLLPESAAPGATVQVRAEVRDDRGIAEVRFSQGAIDLGTRTVPPYEVDLPISPTAVAGSELAVSVVALDTSLNETRQDARLLITALPDTDPPTGVAIAAPEEAVPGQLLTLLAEAFDAVGILAVDFLADGVVVGESSTAPYSLEFTVPEDAEPGSRIVFFARARDFSGNSAASAPAITRVVEPGAAVVHGEVYDDSRGLPVAGARVRVVERLGEPVVAGPETITDAFGRFDLSLPSGGTLLEISQEGSTRVFRALEVARSVVTVPLDARLTPLGPPQPLDELADTTLLAEDVGAEVVVPAGALAGTSALSLTRLSGQGLPAPLPAGWTPVATLHLGPEDLLLNAPLGVEFSGVAAPEELVAVGFDLIAHQWRRLEAVTGEGSLAISAATAGALALIRADTAPAAPPVPAVGELLAGVASSIAPGDAVADVQPRPQVIFLQPDARSEVTVVLDSPLPLASGVLVEVDLQETYDRRDGSALIPAPSTQDVVLYQETSGLLGRLVVSPSQTFDPALLQEGRIDLEVHPTARQGPALLGVAGGEVSSPDGFDLSLPPDAVDAASAIELVTLAPGSAGLDGDDRFNVLGGVGVTIGGAGLAQPGSLSFTPAAEVPPDATVLVVRPVSVGGPTRLELVALATRSDGALVAEAGGLGLPLPGIDAAGRYFFVEIAEPIGFVTGEVTIDTAPVMRGVVEVDSLPFVSLTETAAPSYVVAARLGDATLSGLDLATGSSGAGFATLLTADEIATLNLALTLEPLRVVAVEPADGVSDVPAGVAVTVRFSRALDPMSLAPAAIEVTALGSPVVGSAGLSTDGTTLTFRAAAPLASETRHDLRIASTLLDRFGNALEGNQPDGSFTSSFATADTTPPPRPEAGQIAVGELAGGVVPVSGTQGSVEPDSLVSITNEATGVTSSRLAGADGSFALGIEAGLTDELSLRIADSGGNETQLDLGRATPPFGFAILGSEGGLVEGEGENAALIPPGFLPEDTIVNIAPVDLSGVPEPFGDELPGSVVGAVSFSMAGHEIGGVVELRLEVDGIPAATSVDTMPPFFQLEKEIRIPSSAVPGSVFRVSARAMNEFGEEVELTSELTVVGGTPDPMLRSERLEGMLVLDLTLPAQVEPGQLVSISASAQVPDIKLRFPADESLTGEEQFLLFEIEEINGVTVWSLVTSAELVTLEDGIRVIETSSPPYRGLRADTSQLALAVFTQTTVAFGHVLRATALGGSSGGLVGAAISLIGAEIEFGNRVALGVRLLHRFSQPRALDVRATDFMVVPILGGVPATIQLIDLETNVILARGDVEAIPPGTFSSVLVLGEDDNHLQVTETNSAANGAVPVDGEFTLAFSHLIDPSTIDSSTLFIEDGNGQKVDAEIVFQQDTSAANAENFAVLVRPEAPLRPAARYRLRATTGIRRVGSGTATATGSSSGQVSGGRGLLATFELAFTTGELGDPVAFIDVPGARTFDVMGELALVAQHDDASGINSFSVIDLSDLTAPSLLAERPLSRQHQGEVRGIRGFVGGPGADDFEPMAIVSSGSPDTFGIISFFGIGDPTSPRFLGGTLVGAPPQHLLFASELLVIPTFDQDFQVDIEVSAPGEGLLDGIPQIPALPWMIDTDGHDTVYFINQGLGLMTIDIGRAIPPPPREQRGSQLGPSFIPEDKAGAIVIQGDPSLLQIDGRFIISQPSHLDFAAPDQIETTVLGTILFTDEAKLIRRIVVNGVEAEIARPVPPGPRDFSATIRLGEGVNTILATAFNAEGIQIGSIHQLFVRPFPDGVDPLAGPGTVSLSLPPVSTASGGSVTAQVSASATVRLDQLFINGVQVSAKSPVNCAQPELSACGWSGIGSIALSELSLQPGANSIVATAIDVDEEFPQGRSYYDLSLTEGLIVAVRNDLFLYDASGLVELTIFDDAGQAANRVPIGNAFRVSVATGVVTDRDGDGRDPRSENEDGDDITVFEEVRNLALVGEGHSNKLTFVDITEPHRSKVIGSIDTGRPTYRSAALPEKGLALVAADDSLLVIDITRPYGDTPAGVDMDDRILRVIPLVGGGVRDVRADPVRGVAYVLQRGQGIAIVSIDDCDTDIGIDVTRIPVDRSILTRDLQEERTLLFDGFVAGMAHEDCAAFTIGPGQPGSGSDVVAVRGQGSSACIWREDLRCSTAFQPGISDHDFLFLYPGEPSDLGKRNVAAICTKRIETEIKDPSRLPEVDLSVFPESTEGFTRGYRQNTSLPDDGCGAGDDTFGDGCLGRNGLMLKWLLEGEWVGPQGGPAWNAGIDADEVLRTLRSPLTGTNASSIINNPDHIERSHIPLLEGYEWAILQKYRAEETLARIRILNSGLGNVAIVDPKFLAKLHKLGKAGIRTVLGKLLSSEVGNELILESTRQDYASVQGCLTEVQDPADPGSISNFKTKACETFEEYVASQAIRSCVRNLGLLDCSGDGKEARLAYEFFRIKSDVGPPIADQAKANEFIAKAIEYIGSVVSDLEVDKENNEGFPESIENFNDRDQRIANVKRAVDDINKFLPGGDKFEVKIPTRIFNRGYGVVFETSVDIYEDDVRKKTVDVQVGRSGVSRFFPKQFKLEAKAVPAGEVVGVGLRLDPEDQLVENNKRNNFDGFFYYYLDNDLIGQLALGSAADGAVPSLPTHRPLPPPEAALPDPPASTVCLEAGAAPDSPEIELVSFVNGLESTTFEPGMDIERTFFIRNTGAITISNVVLHDFEGDPISIGEVTAGSSRLVEPKILSTGSIDSASIQLMTLTGMDPEGNSVGVSSTFTRVVPLPTEEPAQLEPVIFIPGMAASHLVETVSMQERWPDGAFSSNRADKERLTLDPGSPGSPVELIDFYAPDVLRSFPVRPSTSDVYATFIEALTDPDIGGYTEFPVDKIAPDLDTELCVPGSGTATLFVFPYDWRKSNAEKVGPLDDLVECVRKIHPDRRIHIVAHSMGGLVTRRYLADHPGKISKVITIGSPWVGGPKAINAMAQGEFLGIPQFLLITKEVLRRVALFSPGVHELLPSRAYFDLGGEPFADDSGSFDYAGYRFVHDEVLYKRSRPISGLADPPGPRTGSEPFHDYISTSPSGTGGLIDDWRNDRSFAEFFHIYGEQVPQGPLAPLFLHKTIARVTIEDSIIQNLQFIPNLNLGTGAAAQASTGAANATGASGLFANVSKTFNVKKGPGDGTVPTLSSTRKYKEKWAGDGDLTDVNLNASRAWLWWAPGSNKDREHNGMMKNVMVRDFVIGVLRPWDPPRNPNLHAPEPAQ